MLGLQTLISVSHETEVNEYLADMQLPVAKPPYHLQDLPLLEFTMGNTQVGGLLGRDLLQHGLFHMNGMDRTFTLGF